MSVHLVSVDVLRVKCINVSGVSFSSAAVNLTGEGWRVLYVISRNVPTIILSPSVVTQIKFPISDVNAVYTVFIAIQSVVPMFEKKERKEMLYLTTHSTHFILSVIW